MKHCHKCGTPWIGATAQPGVKATCDKCFAYLHCCKNCKHHDTTKPNQCRVPNTEAIAVRTAANFCDEFMFIEDAGSRGKPKHTAARDAFDAVFGDDSGVKEMRFEDLFGD